MRVKMWTVAFVVFFGIAASAGIAQEKSAVTLPDYVNSSWGGSGYTSGWEFSPTQDIVVTQLGLALAFGDTYLNHEHQVLIYDSSGTVLTSTTFGAGFITRDASDWYAYNSVASGPTLSAGSTYVVALYAAAVQYDSQILSVDGEVFDAVISVTRKGLYGYNAVGPALPTTDASGSGYEFLGASFKFEPAATVISVQIDIKPGVYPNPINQGANGVIPVAILTTPDFNAGDVDAGTVTLNSATVAVRGKSDKLLARMDDIDGDGDGDLVCQVDTESWGELYEDGYVTLSGLTYAGATVEGQDYVIIVPPQP